MDNQDTTSNNDAVMLTRIEEMIKTHIAQIDELAEIADWKKYEKEPLPEK